MAIVTSMLAGRYVCCSCGATETISRTDPRPDRERRCTRTWDVRRRGRDAKMICNGRALLEAEHRLYVDGRWGVIEGDHIHMEICSEAASWHWTPDR